MSRKKQPDGKLDPANPAAAEAAAAIDVEATPAAINVGAASAAIPTPAPTKVQSSVSHPAPYTLIQIEQMLALPRRSIMALITAGFITPQRGGRHNAYRFTFQDVVLLRTAHQLREARLPQRRLLRSLAQLRAKLPDQVPMSGLRIKVIGKDVAVRDAAAGNWETPSGQLLIDFELAPPPAAPLPFAPSSTAEGATTGGAPAGGTTAGGTPAGGATLAGATVAAANVGAASAANPAHPPSCPDEPADLTRLLTEARTHEADQNFTAAEAAYRQLLALNPAHPDAAINLSALLCDQGRCQDALGVCDGALAALDPDSPAAAPVHFNRAIALEDQQRDAEALAAYEACLAIAPQTGDAHYNAARLHEKAGHRQAAVRHYNAYRRLQR